MEIIPIRYSNGKHGYTSEELKKQVEAKK